jgi:hypothetical protein
MVASGSDSIKALKDEPSAHQGTVIRQTESGSDSTKVLKDDAGADLHTVIAIPGDKTLAEWTPGCLYEVHAEKRSDGALRTCYRFDPNECFSAAGMMQRTVGDDKLKSGAPVFVSLSPARDRWAAGTLSAVTGDRYYVQLDTGLECAKGGKPGLWVGAGGVIASENAD